MKVKFTLSTMLILINTAFTYGSSNYVENQQLKLNQKKSASIYAKNTDTEITKSGFFFNLATFIPSKNYFYPAILGNNDSEFKFGMGFDFELGNMFKIVELDPITIGLRATWFSAGTSMMKLNDTVGIRSISTSIVRVGPYFTYPINDENALDLHYQICPTVGTFLDKGWNSYGEDNYYGFTHELGLSYRYKKLVFGTSYRFGKIMSPNGFGKPISEQDLRNDKDNFKIRTTNVRISIGFKF